LERIFFLWAKLNSNFYVKDINDIVGTLYYVLGTETTPSLSLSSSSTSTSASSTPPATQYGADSAEADTYYLFHQFMLVGDIRDVYYVDLDHSRNPTGNMYSRIQNIQQLLELHDPQLINI